MNKNRGFTLIELLVVLAIMAILAAVFLPSLTRHSHRNNARAAAHNNRVVEAEAPINATQLPSRAYLSPDGTLTITVQLPDGEARGHLIQVN